MTKQIQNSADDSISVQSGRDTNITTGATPEQVKALVEGAVHGAVALYDGKTAAISEALQRLEDFSQRVETRLGSLEGISQHALGDPDLHYGIARAAHAYARSGDEQVADILTNLIASRSEQVARSRLTLTLNESVETAAVLTAEEYAALSVMFFVGNLQVSRVRDWAHFIALLKDAVVPLLADLPQHDASLSYLVSQRCALHSAIGRGSLASILRHKYTGVLSKGFDTEGDEELKQLAVKHPDVFIPCFHDVTKRQLRTLNANAWKEVCEQAGISVEDGGKLWQRFESVQLSDEEVQQKLVGEIPQLKRLFDFWENSNAGTHPLTTIGITIGHSNLMRTWTVEADLGIWVK
ncbi:MAG: LPO_1073/Vpar_1526 family protein [Hyphomicrobiaceae bacterium]